MGDGAHSHGGSALVTGAALGAVAAVAAAVAGVLLVGRLLLDAWSVQGLAYTIGVGSGDGLMWPAATRVVTMVLVVEVAVVVSAVLDWLEADLDVVTWGCAWRVGHLTMPRRVVHRVGWWARRVRVLVVHARRRPAVADYGRGDALPATGVDVPQVEVQDARVLPWREREAA